ncbi:MAG: ZIP family metal transporter [Thermoproteota archaeon]
MDETLFAGAVASLLAGLATGIGAIPVLFVKRVSDRLLDIMLGFSAGVMLAASFFSLIIPAISLGGLWASVLGLMLGAVTLHLADRFTPHIHSIIGLEGVSSSLSRTWLFMFAMTLHNFPEGLAVGISFGTGMVSEGILVATAIGLQNIPEGLASAFPMLREGYSNRKALFYATMTGLVEPMGGLLGLFLIHVFMRLLPVGLAFAAGAMLFIVSDEMIPESHRKGFEREATLGLITGLILMMILDNLMR